MRFFFNFILTILISTNLLAQKTSTIQGKIVDENENPLKGVSVEILGKQKGTISNDSGFFKLEITPNKTVAVVFSYTGYSSFQKNILLSAGAIENVVIRLKLSVSNLTGVTVKDKRERREAGRITIDPTKANVNPSPISGIEQLIKIFVGSNNELTSQYSVRGGSFDENLIYVNDFEVFRPYLVRNGQQEGLSFINPELTGGLKFYNGGFQAKYGDKISS